MPISNIAPDDVLSSPTTGQKLRALPYPSPYFDLAQTYFPVSIKELFQYCIYFYNTHCIVPAIVNKLASYPITDLVFSTSAEKELQKKWKYVLVDELNLTFELFQVGIDLGVYGNSFVGIYFPFKRFLKCNHCDTLSPFNSVKDLELKGKNLDFHGKCPQCNKQSIFYVKDKYIRNPSKLRLIRYDPMAIDIISDPISGEKTYIWEAPSAYKDAIRKGTDKLLLERAPKIILDSIREDKKIKLSKKTFFHMKRPSISGQNSSWGFPLIMHALKSLYYLQVLKMAQEAIAAQHIIPLWILFPQAGNGSTLPPAATIGLAKWKNTIEDELARWRKDRNHVPIVNFPIGFEQIGGEGRALLLGPEVQQEIQQVVASMGVPQEFVFGGLTWTGSSITLRMLENSFQGMRDNMQRFIRFLVNTLSKYLKYKQIDIYMSELKMADDVQRQQIAMNLEATGRISTTRLLSEFGYDFTEEENLKKDEFPKKLTAFIRDNVLQARAQGESSLVALDYQLRAAKKQMEAQSEMGMMPAPAQGMEGQAPNQAQTQGQMDGGQTMPPMASGQASQIDQLTGLPIDPNSGLPFDQGTGLLIDVNNNVAIDPNSGQYFNLDTGEPVDPNMINASSMQGTSLVPDQSAGSTTSLQQAPMPKQASEVDTSAYENKASVGLAASTMPIDIKAMATKYAKALLSTDSVTQQKTLAEMTAEMPIFASLVKQRMAEMSVVEPAINSPEVAPVESTPFKPTSK